MKTNFTILATLLVITLQTQAQPANDRQMPIYNGEGLLQPLNIHNAINTIPKRTNQADNTQSVVSLLDSSYGWGWDTATTRWNVGSKVIYTYDGSNNEINAVNENWSGSAWVISPTTSMLMMHTITIQVI